MIFYLVLQTGLQDSGHPDLSDDDRVTRLGSQGDALGGCRELVKTQCYRALQGKSQGKSQGNQRVVR